MNKLLLFSILFFLSAFSIIAQSPCPTISITAPTSLIKIGDSMTFTAKVDGINAENLKYKWIVSNGEISSGQGTLAINVATMQDMAGQTITATLEVSGLPQNCSKSFSNSAEIEPPICCKDPARFDEYGKILWREEKIRISEAAKALKDNKDLMIFFRIQIKEKKYSQIFKIKKVRIEKYLIESHKISKDRIKIMFVGNDENLTDIWLMPAGVTLPN